MVEQGGSVFQAAVVFKTSTDNVQNHAASLARLSQPYEKPEIPPAKIRAASKTRAAK
jgi:uncharacterized protein involved in tolerance to divalent cations